MKLRIVLALVTAALAVNGACAGKGEREMTIGERIAGLLGVRVMGDRLYPDITGEDRQRQRDLHYAIEYENLDRIRECLEQGADPDKCLGVEGWNSNNPLHMVVRCTTVTYRRYTKEEIPETDVMMMNMLLEAGADINRRPYIWAIVLYSDNSSLNRIKAQPEEKVYDVMTPEEAAEKAESYVKDHNRVLRAFLEAGADPDKLGRVYPFWPERKDFFMSGEEADAYFSKGSRAVNGQSRRG